MADPIPHWPGELLSLRTGGVFVRRAPALPGATPAVFVHGLGGSSTNWTDLMDLLRQEPAGGPPGPTDPSGPTDPPGQADPSGPTGLPPGPTLACEAPDLPGFGFSPPPADGDYSIDARAASVIDLIETQATWPVHLLGNSLGGAVATRVAGRRPDLVRTLTLISPALPDLQPRPVPLRVTMVSMPGMGPWLMRRTRRLTPAQRATLVLGDSYADPGLMDESRLGAEVAEIERRDGLPYADAAMIGSARALVLEYARRGPGTLWRDAARVTAPTLVIYGSHDRLVNPAMAGKAARAFRSARVVVLSRVGHVAMMEQPSAVAREIRGMLSLAASPGLTQVTS